MDTLLLKSILFIQMFLLFTQHPFCLPGSHLEYRITFSHYVSSFLRAMTVSQTSFVFDDLKSVLRCTGGQVFPRMPLDLGLTFFD